MAKRTAPLDELVGYWVAEHGFRGDEGRANMQAHLDALGADTKETALAEWATLTKKQKEEFISGDEDGTIRVPRGARALRKLHTELNKDF